MMTLETSREAGILFATAMHYNKRMLVDELIDKLEASARRAEKGRRGAQEDANEHVGRNESRYDTFKEEAQYLAAGQQHRHARLLCEIRFLKGLLSDRPEILEAASSISAGAIISLVNDEDGTLRRYMLMPAGGGEVLGSPEAPVEVVNINTPLGRLLLGCRPGEQGSRTVIWNGASMKITCVE